MDSKALILIGLSFLVAATSACTVKSEGYTTEDTLVTASQIGFISVFQLNCKNGVKYSLFAEVNGQISPVFRVKDEYQLSWTEEKATAKSGNRNVRLFDEEGFAQFKKAQRNGESTDKIKPLATLQVRYKGSYGSNFLINSEFFVLAISFFAAYVAFQNRMKLVS